MEKIKETLTKIKEIPFVNRLLKKNEALAIILSVILFLVLALARGQYFFSKANLESLQTSLGPYGIIAIGMMILLISGVFDLSVGSVMCFGGLVTALCFKISMPPLLAGLCGVLSGTLIGLLNGCLVEFAGINALITTIGTQYIFRSICNVIILGPMNGTFTNFPEKFNNFGRGQLFGVYYMVWIMAIFMIAFQFFLKKTKAGRQVYFIGGNYTAAKQMGINSQWVRVLCFTISGTLSAFAGVIFTARSGFANRYAGDGIHMNIIIACVIGGGSLAGGQGSILGCFFGMLFMALMSNSFNLFTIPVQWQNIIIGFILLVVIAMDGYISLQKQRKLGKI